MDNNTSQLDLSIFSSEELKSLIALAQSILAEREALEVAAASDVKMILVESIKVCLDKTGKFTMAFTPYHPKMVSEAHDLNGKWQSSNSAWVFDARDEGRVREIVTGVFGTDGSQPVEVCDVQMTLLGNETNDKSRFALGREIVARPARDSRVKLGTGVTIVNGSFTGSGGSGKNPTVMRYGEEAVVVLVRDVPVVLAQAAVESKPEIYQIVA